MKRIIKITDGPVLEDDKDIDIFLAKLQETKERDVRTLLQHLPISVGILKTYKLKLLGTLEIPEIGVHGEFAYPLYEDIDVKINKAGDLLSEQPYYWPSYHFNIDLPEEKPLTIVVKMSITDPLPTVELLIYKYRKYKRASQRQQLIQKRKALYHLLKLEVIKRLEEIRDN